MRSHAEDRHRAEEVALGVGDGLQHTGLGGDEQLRAGLHLGPPGGPAPEAGDVDPRVLPAPAGEAHVAVGQQPAGVDGPDGHQADAGAALGDGIDHAVVLVPEAGVDRGDLPEAALPRQLDRRHATSVGQGLGPPPGRSSCDAVTVLQDGRADRDGAGEGRRVLHPELDQVRHGVDRSPDAGCVPGAEQRLWLHERDAPSWFDAAHGTQQEQPRHIGVGAHDVAEALLQLGATMLRRCGVPLELAEEGRVADDGRRGGQVDAGQGVADHQGGSARRRAAGTRRPPPQRRLADRDSERVDVAPPQGRGGVGRIDAACDQVVSRGEQEHAAAARRVDDGAGAHDGASDQVLGQPPGRVPGTPADPVAVGHQPLVQRAEVVRVGDGVPVEVDRRSAGEQPEVRVGLEPVATDRRSERCGQHGGSAHGCATLRRRRDPSRRGP